MVTLCRFAAYLGLSTPLTYLVLGCSGVPSGTCGSNGVSGSTGAVVPIPASSVALGDVNGDTQVDIVISGGNDVGVLLGVGAGNFASAVTYAAGTGVYSQALADFNHDGRLDILTAGSYSRRLNILFNLGHGSCQIH